MARLGFATAFAIAVTSACGSDEEVGSVSAGDAATDGTGGSAGDAGDAGDAGAPPDAAAGGSGGSGATGGTGSLLCDRDASVDACAERDGATGALVDIIVLADQSASMDQEIAPVRTNLNQSLASILAASSIDYRLILIADKDDPNSVCVDPPLGGPNCGENNPPLFYQVDQRNLSTESLQNFINTFPIWQGYLRPDALRVIVEITDDESAVSDTTFDAWLLTGGGAGYFGTAAERRYVFHSIVGVRNAADPTAPLITLKCNSAVGPGVQYQRLSITTGGLRTPVCGSDYSPVFRAIADLG